MFILDDLEKKDFLDSYVKGKSLQESFLFVESLFNNILISFRIKNVY